MKRAKINPVNQIFRQSAFVYVLLIFSLFEVYFPNHYFRVQEDHMACYIFLTAVFVFMSLFSLLIYLPDSRRMEEYTFGERFHRLLHSLSVTDYAVIAFWIVCIVSTIFSRDPAGSFTGGNGRFMGLGMFSLFFVTYFLVSRGLKFKNSLLLVLFVVSDLLFLLALFQRLNTSFLGFYKNMQPGSEVMYISTVGNIDFFSSYIMLVMPLAACLFCFSDKAAPRWFYLLTFYLGSIALIVTDVDSGYVAVVFLLAILGFFAFRNLDSLASYFLICFAFFTGCKTVYGVFSLGKVSTSFLKAMPRFLVYSNKTVILMIAFLLLFLFAFWGAKEGIQRPKFLAILKAIYIVLVAAIAVGLIAAFLFFSFVNKTKNLGSLTQYLRFNNTWGDNRGYILSLAFGSFVKFNPFQKLFGYGMDMFQLAIQNLVAFRPGPLSQNQTYDSAHNEVVNLLIAVGLLGCLAYLVMVFSQIIRGLRSYKKDITLLALTVSISCYFVQSLANIAIPMVFPVYITLIAISEAILRNLTPKVAVAAITTGNGTKTSARNFHAASHAEKSSPSTAILTQDSTVLPTETAGHKLKKSQKRRAMKQQENKK